MQPSVSHKLLFGRVLVCALALLLTGLAWAITSEAGPYRISVHTDPEIIPVGKARIVLDLSRAGGQPVTGASISVLAQMPSMPMGEREEAAVADPKISGRYIAPAQFGMAGGYGITVKISGPLGPAQSVISVETGQDTAEGGGSLSPAVWWMAGGLLIAILIFARMRKTGQHLNLAPLRNPRVAASILLLAVVLGGCLFAVSHLRPQNAMTPLEAQTMSMDMPPPSGDTPVVLASVEQGSGKATVEYAGQAVGYVEQDVYARVTGTLISMPFYAGDRVTKGEILAKLDSSQIDPQMSQKAAAVQSAQYGEGAARSDYQQAQAMAKSAEDEASEYSYSVAEARANIDAANQNLESMKAAAEGDQASIADRQAILTADQADQTYWTDQANREEQLYNQGFISKDTYEQVTTKKQRADAKVAEAQAKVAMSQTQFISAQAQARQAQAELSAARQRFAAANAELAIHHHHVEEANAAADSAREKIAQAASNLNAARGDLAGVATEKGYTVIRSEIDGVVTERMISPGVLVSPGQSILKIAQINPIRMQANVAQEDLSSIHVGSLVEVSDQKGNAHTARVSSVAPSIDPSARTGLVEAILPNMDGAFLPGQYVSMRIAAGKSAASLSVPASAIQHDIASGAESDSYVWVAHPDSGTPDGYSVKRVSVKTGGENGGRVLVVSGLSPGEQVVTQGAENLADGSMVAFEGPSPASRQILVEIAPNGFSPQVVTIEPGKATTISFKRTTNQTCATQVVFPTLGIHRDLPLNQTVAVDIPPQEQGSLNFACGMNMLHGTVVVK